jgi:hypothetical protein
MNEGSIPGRDNERYFLPYTVQEGAGIAISYGLDDLGVGVRVPVGSRIFSSPDRPDRL